ncbi:MAG: DUF433 domain-containing protein [bacterium]|nr:DUF433 domain-containing protein [bacterium]
MLNRIEINPDIMLGKPVIKGTRITVEAILRKLSQNISVNEILQDYPHLRLEDIQSVLEYATAAIGMEEVVLFAGGRA